MRATAALSGRLRFTTKEVGRGFYRGTRTGAMGSHTEYGGYIIDWRKTRHYVVPDLKDFNVSLVRDFTSRITF
jgi:large subunit ribosomal protein L41